MLYERRDIHVQLAVLARKISRGTGEEDLVEEGIVCLWRAEGRMPGRSVSWYMQGCYHRMQDVARIGRSVDSPKRARSAVSLEQQGFGSGGDAALEGLLIAQDDPFGEASARDMLRQIVKLLSSVNRQILALAMEGWSLRAIGSILGVSVTTIHERFRQIRAAARRLGIRPEGE